MDLVELSQGYRATTRRQLTFYPGRSSQVLPKLNSCISHRNLSSIEKSVLKCKFTQPYKLWNLTLGYEPEICKTGFDADKVMFNFPSHILADFKIVYFARVTLSYTIQKGCLYKFSLKICTPV